MSEKVDEIAQNIVENAMMDAVDVSRAQVPNVIEVANQQESVASINNNSDEKVGQIVQSVTELAGLVRDFSDDLQNFQIGDYVLSVNITPLEIQLKRAISNLHLSEVESKNIIHPGDGKVEVSLSSEALTTHADNVDQNTVIPVNSEREIIKKRMTFVARLRRFFRIGKSPTKNS
ncbi:uncharacterized protein LOC122848801 isoform X2 [Aphidius gifuensis]|uniref:uncharacterized protein LOC122848801 isoform X2 n=1 Tax=Aphidius gifuensis TaxID=684658 RepID=UPI001CDB4AEF|nr:uncharacterized protein LOC122848801 isoform X2 [Aphidius gifuensis]